MTSTQPLPLPYLELPMPDDVMELSSEYDRRPGTDEDIDIDIDFVTEEVQDQDNDYIIEDASEVGIGGQDSVVEMGNDDIMLDEEGSLAETHDDTLVQDEDIDDVRDFTLNEFNNESAPIQEVTDQFHDEAENHGQYTALPDDRPYDAPLDDFEGKITEASDNQTFGIRQGEQLGTIEGDADVEELRQQTPDPNPEALRGSSLNYSGDEPNGDQSLVPAGKSPIALSASDVKPEVDLQLKDLLSDPGISHAEAFPHDEEPVNPVTSLHPVVVIYQGNEISLFPPSDRSDSSTFFLHHESLANNSMSDLLTACKEVLADSISEEAELEFRIEELGLRISEDSKSASSITLSQILNVYLQLLHQDGVNDADPLYMILNINTSSRKRFSALLDAANRGKGLSQLPYWEVPDDDPNGVAAAHDEADASEEPADQETEDAQNADKTPEKLDPATGDDPSTEDVSQATDNDVSTLQGNATTTISSSKITDSRTSKAEASRAASDSNSAPLLNSTQSDTIPAPEIGKELQDPTSSHHGVNHTAVSPHDNFAPDLDESGVEEGDLIDYEDGDEPAIQDSTGSSTLAGDDDADAAIGNVLNSQYDSVTGSTAIEIKEHPADNLAPNTRKMAPSASLGLRAGDDELDPPIDESLSANDGQEASESAGQVDSDQLGSIDSDATRAKESLPSFSKEELDDSAVHIAHPYYSDDANDAAGIPGTPEIRKDGTTENAEQDFDHPKDPTHEVSAIEEEVLIGSQPKGTSSESHEKSSNGQVTAIESLKETSDGYAGRNEDQAVTQINYLDPQSSTIVSTAEEDVISYDEEDDFDLVSDQEGEGNLQSLLSSPSTSTKRSHDATEDQGAPDDGLQDAKRVRSG